MRNRDKLFYIASPYSSFDPTGVEHNVLTAARVCSQLMAMGYNVISPVVYGHSLVECVPDADTAYQYWQSLCESLMLRCDALLIIDMRGTRQSKGVEAEMDFFHHRGFEQKDYLYIRLDENEDRITNADELVTQFPFND